MIKRLPVTGPLLLLGLLRTARATVTAEVMDLVCRERVVNTDGERFLAQAVLHPKEEAEAHTDASTRVRPTVADLDIDSEAHPIEDPKTVTLAAEVVGTFTACKLLTAGAENDTDKDSDRKSDLSTVAATAIWLERSLAEIILAAIAELEVQREDDRAVRPDLREEDLEEKQLRPAPRIVTLDAPVTG